MLTLHYNFIYELNLPEGKALFHNTHNPYFTGIESESKGKGVLNRKGCCLSVLIFFLTWLHTNTHWS